MLAAALAGESAAYAALHDRLAPGLRRHFARTLADHHLPHDPDAADELAQRTWILFHGALTAGKYDPGKSRLSTFLYAVARIVWLRHRRAVASSRLHPLPDGPGAPDPAEVAMGLNPGLTTTDEPAEVAHFAAGLELLRRVAGGEVGPPPPNELTDADRELLRLVARGLSDRELAAELGCAPSSAHARKHNLFGRLRVFFRSRGFSI